MEFDPQPGLIVFTPQGQTWAKEYLCQPNLFVVSGLNLDLEHFTDLLSDEIQSTMMGVNATVDAVYKAGTPEEHPLKVQVLVRWEYIATIFYAKDLRKRGAVGFRL